MNGRALIADATALIGEFVASVPAIRAYVRNHPEVAVDLLVSPVNAPLARKIRGIGNVYVTEREADRDTTTLPEYGVAFALRINDRAYRMLRNAPMRTLRTGAKHFAWYASHLLWSLRKRETPVQWREMNFRMLGEEPCEIPFDEVFHFGGSERNQVLQMPEMQTDKKRIIVHTGTNWIMKQWENGKWIELLNRLNEKVRAEFVFV
ncbi:MAG: hypothetical protein WA194_08095 [Patescibacteria group bacterium]